MIKYFKKLDEKKENIAADELRAIINPNYNRNSIHPIWRNAFVSFTTEQAESLSGYLKHIKK